MIKIREPARRRLVRSKKKTSADTSNIREFVAIKEKHKYSKDSCIRGKNQISMKTAKIGIINVSDRASRGEYEDIPGKEVKRLMNLWLTSLWEAEYRVIPDEQDQLEAAMIDMADNKGCCLIVTTGGTGPAVRDVTPEATEAVCEKMMPGFGELMRQTSLQYVPTAILSRQTAGIRKKSLIVNLPGKPKAIKECLEVVFPAIPYCIDLIEGPYLETNPEEMKVFRPKSK